MSVVVERGPVRGRDTMSDKTQARKSITVTHVQQIPHLRTGLQLPIAPSRAMTPRQPPILCLDGIPLPVRTDAYCFRIVYPPEVRVRGEEVWREGRGDGGGEECGDGLWGEGQVGFLLYEED